MADLPAVDGWESGGRIGHLRVAKAALMQRIVYVSHRMRRGVIGAATHHPPCRTRTGPLSSHKQRLA